MIDFHIEYTWYKAECKKHTSNELNDIVKDSLQIKKLIVNKPKSKDAM